MWHKCRTPSIGSTYSRTRPTLFRRFTIYIKSVYSIQFVRTINEYLPAILQHYLNNAATMTVCIVILMVVQHKVYVYTCTCTPKEAFFSGTMSILSSTYFSWRDCSFLFGHWYCWLLSRSTFVGHCVDPSNDTHNDDGLQYLYKHEPVASVV